MLFTNDELNILIEELQGMKDFNNELYQSISDDSHQSIYYMNEKTRIYCECGITFYTDFPIETNPACDDCPNCKKR